MYVHILHKCAVPSVLVGLVHYSALDHISWSGCHSTDKPWKEAASETQDMRQRGLVDWSRAYKILNCITFVVESITTQCRTFWLRRTSLQLRWQWVSTYHSIVRILQGTQKICRQLTLTRWNCSITYKGSRSTNIGNWNMSPFCFSHEQL